MDDRTHPIQRLMDNPWALLALGILIPVLSYTLWGLIGILTMPTATLQ